MNDSVNAPLISHNFQGITIQQRAEDGYLNATAMCAAAGKRWPEYIRLDSSKAFLEALSLEVQICTSKLVQTIRGRGDRVAQGTWVHPYVAINLAQWLSPEFAVQVSKWVFQWLGGDADHPREESPQVHNQSMAQALNMVSLTLQVWGRKAAQDIWDKVGLPPIDPACVDPAPLATGPRPDSDEGKILAYIQKAGADGVARNAVARRFRKIRAVDLDHMINSLVEIGLIARSAHETAGRPIVVLTAEAPTTHA